ncbi:hypothetical protein [Marispirochaeta sp.]|jgi:hypothetical protein|uniref:hypothetical protein n=1 Tax=Marispirochaeta sp. TaxID=2038653 RepID=UPI0029C73F1F|nr:hypothetical protein [Marispirochaeta sp.]
MSDEYDELQADLESEAGGTILNHAMVRIQPGTTSPELMSDLFGLLVITPSRLLYKHYAQENWFSGMFSAKNRKSKEISLLIDFSDIVSIKRIAEASFFKRLLFTPEPYYSIHYRDTNRIQRTVQLSVSFCKTGEPVFYKQLTEAMDKLIK